MKPSLGILALAALLPVVAWGQSASLAPGARVRVTSPSDNLKRHVTTVTEVRGDSIVMSGSSGSRTIALANVTSLDVSAGKRNNVGRYALIGFGTGAMLGLSAGLGVDEECDWDYMGELICSDPGGGAAWDAGGALAFGAVGLLTGAIVGRYRRTDRWEKHPGIRASVAPSASGGVTLRVSRAF